LRKDKVLAIVAYLLMIGGLILIGWSFLPSEGSDEITVPAGDYFYRWKTPSMINGHVSGDYEVIGSGVVQVYVLNSAQYDEFAWDMFPTSSLDDDMGASGSFSADLADTSGYYITVSHGTGYEDVDQTVKVTYKVTGIAFMFMIGGIAFLVIGAVLAVVSMRMKAKARAMEPAPPAPASQPTDVTMFDTKRKT